MINSSEQATDGVDEDDFVLKSWSPSKVRLDLNRRLPVKSAVKAPGTQLRTLF